MSVSGRTKNVPGEQQTGAGSAPPGPHGPMAAARAESHLAAQDCDLMAEHDHLDGQLLFPAP